MTRLTVWSAVAAVMLTLGLAYGACSEGDDGGVPATATSGASEGTTVAIVMSEWTLRGEEDGALSAAAGDVTFEVENIGLSPHELAVIKTELDPAALPVADTVVDEEAAGELMGRTDPIGESGDATLTLDLEAGTYALICNIATHYDLGMHAQLVVE